MAINLKALASDMLMWRIFRFLDFLPSFPFIRGQSDNYNRSFKAPRNTPFPYTLLKNGKSYANKNHTVSKTNTSCAFGTWKGFSNISRATTFLEHLKILWSWRIYA